VIGVELLSSSFVFAILTAEYPFQSSESIPLIVSKLTVVLVVIHTGAVLIIEHKRCSPFDFSQFFELFTEASIIIALVIDTVKDGEYILSHDRGVETKLHSWMLR
jgi:hypothetical protein